MFCRNWPMWTKTLIYVSFHSSMMCVCATILPFDSIAEIIAEPYPIITLENLQEHDRIDYMANILSLILIDGKVLPTEIQLCLTMGKRLGFETGSLNTFLLELRDKADVSKEYLKKKWSNWQKSTPHKTKNFR